MKYCKRCRYKFKLEVTIEGPEGVNWELGVAFFALGKWDLSQWEWDCATGKWDKSSNWEWENYTL
jgi:hypothetical protein